MQIISSCLGYYFLKIVLCFKDVKQQRWSRPHYSIGDLPGVPGFRGYFLGVCFSFFMIKMLRSLSSIGSVNVWTFSSLPPSVEIAFFAVSNSSLACRAFIAIKCPPTFANGKQNSLKTDILATARAVTTSKLSR